MRLFLIPLHIHQITGLNIIFFTFQRFLHFFFGIKYNFFTICKTNIIFKIKIIIICYCPLLRKIISNIKKSKKAKSFFLKIPIFIHFNSTGMYALRSKICAITSLKIIINISIWIFSIFITILYYSISIIFFKCIKFKWIRVFIIIQIISVGITV